jgi:hypothetical protein
MSEAENWIRPILKHGRQKDTASSYYIPRRMEVSTTRTRWRNQHMNRGKMRVLPKSDTPRKQYQHYPEGRMKRLLILIANKEKYEIAFKSKRDS